ncbi:hypothetical protein EVAR_12039_1 [Eumeta japonica]|uniref:Retrovirus-related Pol polyprotein from type-1 retrotransposable element R1 3 n=1 Tax=Eumeta variegata TaxID=151549 RepID=A0A4C1U595_EUMVA|nr:hypothetical protein EVAR_12039_1 [Eumeta japonica]
MLYSGIQKGATLIHPPSGPLAHEVRRDISEIVAEGRAVRLFWVRAHAESRETSVQTSSPGAPPSPRRRQRNMIGFRCRMRKGVEKSYRVLRDIEMTSHMAQTLTGHGGFAQYLFKFKLRDSPHCACDPAKIQDVLHVLEDCDMFLRKRAALEAGIGVAISRRHFPEILDDAIYQRAKQGMRAIREVITATHRHSQYQRSHQCVVSLLGKNRISAKRYRGVVEGEHGDGRGLL